MKLHAFVLAVLFVLSLSGCGREEEVQLQNQSNGPKRTNLVKTTRGVFDRLCAQAKFGTNVQRGIIPTLTEVVAACKTDTSKAARGSYGNNYGVSYYIYPGSWYPEYNYNSYNYNNHGCGWIWGRYCSNSTSWRWPNWADWSGYKPRYYGGYTGNSCFAYTSLGQTNAALPYAYQPDQYGNLAPSYCYFNNGSY